MCAHVGVTRDAAVLNSTLPYSPVLSELCERDISQNLTVGVCHVEHPACPIRRPPLDHPHDHISCRDAGGFGVCQLRSAVIGNGFVGTPAMEEVAWHD